MVVYSKELIGCFGDKHNECLPFLRGEVSIAINRFINLLLGILSIKTKR